MTKALMKYEYVLEPPDYAHGGPKSTSWMKVWVELSDLCKAYPNLWFVANDIPATCASAIKKGKPKSVFAPAGSFEATMRDCYKSTSGQMMGTLYLRYIG